MATEFQNTIVSPWHSGEIEMQEAVGVADRMAIAGPRVIRSFMPDQHRDFYEQLPFIVAGSVDGDGNAWATLLAGGKGFIESPDPVTLKLNHQLDTNDPASTGLEVDGDIGILGIELHSRRRNRMNGHISQSRKDGFYINVEHSFGNCPQYIQLRNFQMVQDHQPAEPVWSNKLSDDARALIENADTFFVASYVDEEEGRQVDVSHRGGKTGFVHIGDDGVLTIPDFAGNLHYNTLGNFLKNPKAGLIFCDFETGDVLQMTGSVAVILESPEISAFQGAERLWTFTPEKLVVRKAGLPIRWTFQDEGWSPNSLMTGDWDAAKQRVEAQALRDTWRDYRVSHVVEESSVIRSFVLEPSDGSGLIPHEAGQHLPIRVPAGADGKKIFRTYTLSTAPSDGKYRISVKKQGLVSSFLHDQIKAGDIIEAKAPSGCFTIDALERRPAVLLAAGVGITPMLSMLRHIVFEGVRKRHIRPTWLFYAARTVDERAFDREIVNLLEAADCAVRVIRLIDQVEGKTAGDGYEVNGRLDMELLKAALPFDDHEFYMCGPPLFMQSIYDGLRGLNISDKRVHAEAFGPASLARTLDVGEEIEPANVVADHSVPVAFTLSSKEARWSPESGTLLNLAESRGLTPEFSCRGGSCGTCKTKIIEGAVAYETPPTADFTEEEALICCAMPAHKDDSTADRLILDL